MASKCFECEQYVGSSHKWDCRQRRRSVLVLPRDTTKTRTVRWFRVVRPSGEVILQERVTVQGVGRQPFTHWQGRGDGRLDIGAGGYLDPIYIDPPWRVEYRDEDSDEWVLAQSSDPTEIML